MSDQATTIESNTRRVLRPRAFAEFIDAHLDSVYAWLAAGEIPGAFRLGRCWFIDIDVFLAETSTASAPATSGD